MVEHLFHLVEVVEPAAVALAIAAVALAAMAAASGGPWDDRAVPDLSSIRSDYDWGTLDEADLPVSPLDAVAAWVDDAVARGVPEPGAMVVSTATPDGVPSSRTVLLRGISGGGLVFFSNRSSRKGVELASNPRCAAVLRWDDVHRQVCVTGAAQVTTDEESDAYFASRPRASRVGAWASTQSQVLADRAELEARVAEAEARYPDDDVPRPPHWGGYRIVPDAVELWQGRPSRLHDRLRYRRGVGAQLWVVERLAP